MHSRRAFIKSAATSALAMPWTGRADILPSPDPAGAEILPAPKSTDIRFPSHARRPGLAWQAVKGGQQFLLVGTIHALAAQDHPLPQLIDSCYAQANGLLMEFTPYEQAQPKAKQALQAKGLLPEARSLMSLLPDETKQNLRSFLAVRPGLTFLLDCKPWLAAQWIQQTLAAECGLEGVHGVESYLSRRAGADRKAIQLLESQEDALQALDGLPDTAQLESLKLTLNLAQQGKYRSITDTLKAAWRTGDEARLNALFASTTEDSLAYRKAIIEDRNHLWLKRIQSLKAAGTWLIAGGTQHFCGNNSIPTLLRAEGFEVNRLT